MICGSPQTDEEQQEKTRRRRKRKRGIPAEGGEARKGEERVKPLAMYTGCSIHTPHFSSSSFSLPAFLPHRYFPPLVFSSPSPSFLDTACNVPSVHLPAHIAHPHATRERERERERRREDQALGPWRNQFKWLSVDVIDFHFTRLSRGRRSSTRCVASTPTPEQLQSVLHPRVSPFHALFLPFSIAPHLPPHASLYLFLSRLYFCFPFSLRQPHTRATHTCATSSA